MFRTLSRLIFFSLLACSGAAQSVRPTIVEYTAAGEGSFEVVNDTILPLYVAIEAKSFTIDNQGMAHFKPLESNIHLQLSQTSVRLPPRSRRTLFYKASADSYPAWFCIYSDFSGAPRRNSVNVSLELPHTVYLLNKGRSSSPGVLTFAGLRRSGDTLVGSVTNEGSNVVRVESLQLIDENGKKHDEGGFPLLPGGSRDLQLTLRPDERPKVIRAKFGRATAESAVQ